MTATPFALALRQARDQAGISQNILAKRTGLFSNHICRMENGQRGASASTVARLARGLRLSAAETDRLMMSAGYAPRDMTGLVIDTCELLSIFTDDSETKQDADRAAMWLRQLADRLMRRDFDLNLVIAGEGPTP